MKDLDAIFSDVVDAMASCIHLQSFEYSQNFPFCYEEGGFSISGVVNVTCEWDSSGDGHDIPNRSILTYAFGIVEDLFISYFDEDSGDGFDFPENVTVEYSRRLETALDIELSKLK